MRRDPDSHQFGFVHCTDGTLTTPGKMNRARVERELTTLQGEPVTGTRAEVWRRYKALIAARPELLPHIPAADQHDEMVKTADRI